LINQPLGMPGDPEQHVLDVEERRHVDQFAALDERVEECGSARALETARK
jgi:hypothetical protein